jgi:hypothetical protein
MKPTIPTSRRAAITLGAAAAATALAPGGRAGDEIDPALYYFRAASRFSTTAPEFAFLMDFVCVCTGVRRRDAAILTVFSIL